MKNCFSRTGMMKKVTKVKGHKVTKKPQHSRAGVRDNRAFVCDNRAFVHDRKTGIRGEKMAVRGEKWAEKCTNDDVQTRGKRRVFTLKG